MAFYSLGTAMLPSLETLVLKGEIATAKRRGLLAAWKNFVALSTGLSNRFAVMLMRR